MRLHALILDFLKLRNFHTPVRNVATVDAFLVMKLSVWIGSHNAWVSALLVSIGKGNAKASESGNEWLYGFHAYFYSSKLAYEGNPEADFFNP